MIAQKHSRRWMPMLIALLATVPSLAQGPGWTGGSKVKEIVSTANGGFNVRLEPELVNCVSQSGYGPSFASVYPDHPGLKQLNADLTVALVNGNTVALYLTDADCTVGEVRLLAN